MTNYNNASRRRSRQFNATVDAMPPANRRLFVAALKETTPAEIWSSMAGTDDYVRVAEWFSSLNSAAVAFLSRAMLRTVKGGRVTPPAEADAD